ncbi:MAG: HAMP domain-containing protein [Anaerolineales bacterium]|nr:HAMP domain-containing protein [Anaerolineales bacterium]
MALLKRFFSRFVRLQWKLALSYSLVTTLIVTVTLLGLLLFAYTLIDVEVFGVMISSLLPQMTEELPPYFAEEEPDVAALGEWLDSVYNRGRLNLRSADLILNEDDVEYVAVTDATGRIIAGRPLDQIPADLRSALSAEAELVLDGVLAGDLELSDANYTDSDSGVAFLASPILADDGQTLGALIVTLRMPANNSDIFTASLAALGPIILGALLLTSVAGTIFGFFAARGYARRLSNLTAAADSWSQGDFSIMVQDKSADEIGLLARRLNRMAQELQTLLQTRQELAMLEERNRLARDLHDSVKQQVFATAMQTGAARALLENNPVQAKTHLQEAEQLAQLAQQELTELIQELRPAALDGMGLVRALRNLADSWTRQQNIPTQVRVQGDRPLPLHIEQALYRVTQEALMNAAKHSRAGALDIHVAMSSDDVTLTIQDNGQGFDVAQVSGTGLGLYSMHERLAALGGSLQIESRPGAGTTIVAHCPLVRYEKV